jgi:hypothetical protein
MGNLSYCRHENTLNDLQDCFDVDFQANNIDDAQAALDLYRLCVEIANSIDMSDLEERLEGLRDEECDDDEEEEDSDD